MRARFAFPVVLAAALAASTGCTSNEAPEVERDSAGSTAPPAAAERAAAEGGARQTAPAAAAASPVPLPVKPFPTGVIPTSVREETPCDRNEPGWVLKGTLVEDGKCVVGPCDCIEE